ncbi:FAD/NAD(P)-binding domain-containing protein [Pseudovirgaria hyperparasitica]|uniref:FAD/NAD(P)-binding domain-containing protein n=1 Tax=Pseudovirgaria hyperparasitica TaxID=470096 RepID=A0A6A6W7G3_9PEZI|nr:FAD/NAD(P)-binding domain-containing protein [Pseudovirgaria hyperparasitica]KAF2757517.1 FAD/NAD(P)-binding domain-containing protein [Pseudovirgaria hyperparasitica]
MPRLKVLICGGGCAGPALAFWLARSGHDITIIERHTALRASGAQIDLRAQGIEVVRRMGLLDAVRAQRVDEDGVSMVDTHGRVLGKIGANTTGKGAQTATSEYEIMRGDLEGVRYVFGVTVEGFEQDDGDDGGVVVRLSDGTAERYDLLVGADGQGSRIRRAMMPAVAPDPVCSLGMYMAYFFIPRIESDTKTRSTYAAPGSRMMMRRTHSPTESQAYFILKDSDPELRSLPRAPVDVQKAFWTQRFQDAGWQAERFTAAMASTENFYCHEVAQIKIASWHRGRVVLLADAAHCPSPFTAMGTTSAFVGAYVLAGELEASGGDVVRALEKYESTLRPFVEEIQKLNTSLVRLAYPQTVLGVRILQLIFAVVSFLRIPQLIARFSDGDKGGWRLPEYPMLRKGR